MTLDALRCLCAVVETGSFREAAERLHRSQPAISQQVKSLEEELGRGLVVRKGGTLTDAGQRVYGRAQRLLNEARNLKREMEEFDEARERPLRVGTSDTTAIYFLPPLVRRFSQSMPDVHLVLVNRSTQAISDQILRDELDLGIVTLPVNHPDIEERELFREKLVLVTPAAHRYAGRKRLKLAAVAEEPFLMLDPQRRTGALLRRHLDAAGFAPTVVLNSGSFEVIKRYVAEGIGLSFLPEMTVSQHDTGLAKVAVPELPRIAIGAIWRRGAYQGRAERAFIDLISP